jgi:NAD(P)-dependent dehydrogenase (short-subunit alcohol dehydrogenase family)
MDLRDELSYAGKRAVVTGAASGMGLATVRCLAELGAEILALDVQPVAEGPWTPVVADMADTASLDAAVEVIGAPVHALFNVAGIAGGRGREKQTMMVNFYGLRYLTERLLPSIARGGAIVSVSSLAGFRYLVAAAELEELLALSIDDAQAWLDREENQPKFNGYGTSKELLNLWTCRVCKDYAESHGVRINVVAPGTTDTPLLDAFRENAIERTGSADAVEGARGFLGRFSHAEDQAAACVFLNSAAASMITGVILPVDGGMDGFMTGNGIDPGPRGR